MTKNTEPSVPTQMILLSMYSSTDTHLVAFQFFYRNYDLFGQSKTTCTVVWCNFLIVFVSISFRLFSNTYKNCCQQVGENGEGSILLLSFHFQNGEFQHHDFCTQNFKILIFREIPGKNVFYWEKQDYLTCLTSGILVDKWKTLRLGLSRNYSRIYSLIFAVGFADWLDLQFFKLSHNHHTIIQKTKLWHP